jgi:hypothetical protein
VQGWCQACLFIFLLAKSNSEFGSHFTHHERSFLQFGNKMVRFGSGRGERTRRDSTCQSNGGKVRLLMNHFLFSPARMGSLLSSHDTVVVDNLYIRDRNIGKHQYQFSCLNLSEEDIGKFYIKFRTLDTDNSGTIDSKELFNCLSLSKSRFATRIFNFYDIDHSGESSRTEEETEDLEIAPLLRIISSLGKMDFYEFILVTWNFCTIDKKYLGRPLFLSLCRLPHTLFSFSERFIYELYDVNRTGELPYSEIAVITKEIYGREFKKNQNLQKYLTSLPSSLTPPPPLELLLLFKLKLPTLCHVMHGLNFVSVIRSCSIPSSSFKMSSVPSRASITESSTGKTRPAIVTTSVRIFIFPLINS